MVGIFSNGRNGCLPQRVNLLIDKVIGQKIRELRNRWGLSQSELAERIGISFQQIQKYEKGSSRISVMRLQQIAEALGASPASFIEEGEKRLKITDVSVKYADDESSRETPNEPLSKEEITLLRLFRKVKNRKLREGILKQVRGVVELEKMK